MDNMALQVYLPTQCLMSSSGLLIGSLDFQKKRCCVTGILEFEDKFDHSDLSNVCDGIARSSNLQTSQYSISVLGVWNNKTQGGVQLDSYDVIRAGQGCHFLEILKLDSQLPDIKPIGLWKSEHDVINAITFVYDANIISQSYFLTCDESSVKASESSDTSTHLEFLSRSVKITNSKSCSTLENLHNLRLNIFTSRRGTSYCFYLLTYIVSLLMIVSKFFEWISRLRIWQTWLFTNILSAPSVFHQLLEKNRTIRLISSEQSRGSSELRQKNALIRLVFDLIAGLVVLYLVIDTQLVPYIGDMLMSKAEIIAIQLQDLLQWMMGVPAGLKVNSQLAHFLGKFFTYHIYLWTGYLRFLRPVWNDALWCISWSGCLGMSVQIALLQDLLSMMTLHIYCFYVYAARLYSLQVAAMSSLWRLFRGKKWNPLRERMDSSSFDIDQLFIGTLIFTILLFLLPTTALFYTVFAGLRLLVLGLQGTFHLIILTMNKFPAYSIYLRLTDSGQLSGAMRVHIVPQSAEKNLALIIEFVPASFISLIVNTDAKSSKSDKTDYTWGKLLSYLLSGKLVYPWIDIES